MTDTCSAGSLSIRLPKNLNSAFGGGSGGEGGAGGGGGGSGGIDVAEAVGGGCGGCSGRPLDVLPTSFWGEVSSRGCGYLRDIVEHLVLGATFYLLLCVLLYAAAVRWKLIGFKRDVRNPRRVLLVIAHPDDECMFFGPTVVDLARRPDCLLYLMCLSTGHNYGMGSTRKAELYSSSRALGIDDERVIVHRHSMLPDEMECRWPNDVLCSLILQQVEAYDIDTLITFDRHGVSGHANHISLYYAAVTLKLDKRLPEQCAVYVLESVSVLRKYWMLLDMPLSYLLSRTRYLLTFRERRIVQMAMREHKSQLLWFRRLYMHFSRYTMINTLQEMDVTDIELDLELDDD